MNFDEYIRFEFERINNRLERVENMIRNMPVMSNQNLGDWLSEAQAQELLGYGATSLWGLRKASKLIASKIGGKTYYSKDSIIAFLEKNKEKCNR